MDTDKIKDFFVYNFEKMILVVVIGVSVFLIYSGSQQPVFTAKNDPDDLKTKANQVKSDIDLDHNEVVINGGGEEPSRRPTFDIVAATDRSATGVDDSFYKSTNKWVAGAQSGKKIRRQDPRLAPPESLVLTSVASVISVQGRSDDTYALLDLEAADPLEKVEKKRRRKKRRSSRGNAGGEGEGEGMGMEGMGMEGMGMEGMGMEGMGMGDSTGSDGPTRKFDGRFDFGYRPLTEDKIKPVPTFGRFIVGTAVVPYKEIYEQYSLALSDSQGYTPGRDSPMFCDMQIRRADVTDKAVEELKKEDWVQLRWDRKLLTELAARKWAGFAPEIVPDDYRDDALSLWLPPVLLDDYRPYASHPLIPSLSRDELERRVNAADDGDDEPTMFNFEGDDDTVLASPGSSGSNSGGSMGSMGDMSMGDMSMGDMEGMGGGMGMGMGMAMMGRGFDPNPPEYKLVRFYDFANTEEFFNFKNPQSPRIGRRYVYSIRYAVDDPNFPRFPIMQPQLNTLDADVAARVKDMMSAVKTIDDRTKMSKKWSEWSTPSKPVSISTVEEYYVGPVTAGKVNVWEVDGKEVHYMRDIPTATLATCNFDAGFDAKVPVRVQELFEGATLSVEADHADVVDPITMAVKKTPPVQFVSETTIVDIDGGLPLGITEDLNEPGMILLFDQDGSLHLNDDISDMEMYRINSYADERGE
ncbi:hypothetical protein N9248_01300 [bacterium]|nr:hypothetical protein [bacterium]